MKRTLVVLVFLIGVSYLVSLSNEKNSETKTESVSGTDYCDGWEDGYCEGWKDVKGQYAICPVTPICPIPEIDCSEGYRCGYNRGFKAGMRAAQND